MASAEYESVLDGVYTVPHIPVMDVPEALRTLMDENGWQQAELATELGTTQATISRWMNGADPKGKNRDAIRALLERGKIVPGRKRVVPVMGRIGAGQEIVPDDEQIPPEGLFEVEIPYDSDDDAVAFEIQGESMWPRYDPGDIIICSSIGDRLETLLGYEAALRTADGRRFLKRILRGANKSTFDLESHNAPPIRGVGIEWASAVVHVVRAGRWRKLTDPQKAREARKGTR